MRIHPKALAPLTAIAAAVALVACGGGGGNGDVATATPDAPNATILAGTAATGAALVGAQVTVTDRNGAAACEDSSSLTTGTAGEYRCVLKASAEAPFVIVAVDPNGLVSPMVSLATERPANGASSTANVSRLTTAIAAQLAPNKDPFAFVNDSSVLAALDPGTLEALKTKVATQLAEVLADLGIDAASFDPITTPFVGGSNAGADALLDQVVVRFENGTPMLANLLSPAEAPVAMADATTAAPGTVKKATVSGFSVTELDFAKYSMEACFAVPSTTRDASGECDGFLVDDAPTELTGGATYLHNGFHAEQAFGPLLASAEMDGARFNRPELLRYLPQADGKDEAVINVKFTDRNGVPDNRILVVKKFPGTQSATRLTDWWLYGNQRSMNLHVRATVRQEEQRVPEDQLVALGNLGASRYLTGLNIYIAKPCDDPVNVCPGTSDVRYVRVKGPGLPDAGLVYADVDLPQAWMAILNADGVIPAGAQQFASTSNNLFWLQRSAGISGASAFQIRPNPGVAAATAPFDNWAHPSMYAGQTPSATWALDLGQVPAWSEYTFEVFRGTETVTPSEAITTRMVTPVVPATYAATQRWHVPTDATKALASAGAPAVATLDLAWTVNPYAERIESVQVYSNVNSASVRVPKGANAVTATAVTGEFAALSLTPESTHRQLQFRYRMVDGSYRDMTTRFK